MGQNLQPPLELLLDWAPTVQWGGPPVHPLISVGNIRGFLTWVTFLWLSKVFIKKAKPCQWGGLEWLVANTCGLCLSFVVDTRYDIHLLAWWELKWGMREWEWCCISLLWNLGVPLPSCHVSLLSIINDKMVLLLHSSLTPKRPNCFGGSE